MKLYKLFVIIAVVSLTSAISASSEKHQEKHTTAENMLHIYCEFVTMNTSETDNNATQPPTPATPANTPLVIPKRRLSVSAPTSPVPLKKNSQESKDDLNDKKEKSKK